MFPGFLVVANGLVVVFLGYIFIGLLELFVALC